MTYSDFIKEIKRQCSLAEYDDTLITKPSRVLALVALVEHWRHVGRASFDVFSYDLVNDLESIESNILKELK